MANERATSGSSNAGMILTFISWSALPPILTNVLLTALYTLGLLSRPTNQGVAAQHAARARAGAVTLYLLYMLYRAFYSNQSGGGGYNYYELLGVHPHLSDSDDVKRAFRKMARLYHPDKVGPKGEAIFLLMRRASDTLSDPVKRWAYDRFGPDVMQWDLVTLNEHASRGLKGSIAFYAVNPAVFGIMSWLQGEKLMTFARFTLLLFLASLELSLATTAWVPSPILLFRPLMTPHNLVLFLHELYTSLLLASRQVVPLIPAVLGVEDMSLEQRKDNVEDLEKDLSTVAEGAKAFLAKTKSALQEMELLLRDDLTPVRPSRLATPSATVEAAARSALSNDARAQAAAKAGAELEIDVDLARLPPREPSGAERAWMDAFAERILRKRLEGVPGVLKEARNIEAEKAKSGALDKALKSAQGTTPAAAATVGQIEEAAAKVAEANGEEVATA